MHFFLRYCKCIFNPIPLEKYFEKLYNRIEVKDSDTRHFRNDINIDSKLKPILIMGCSFAYGAGLKDDETFSYKLGLETGRPVYNRSIMGGGLSNINTTNLVSFQCLSASFLLSFK